MQKSDNCISKTQCTKFSFQILKQTIVSCKSFCCISHLWNHWMQPFSSTPFLHSLTPIHSCKLFSLQCLFGYPDWHSFPPSHRQCIPDLIYYLHLKKKMLPIFPESSVHFLKPQPLCPGTINEWVQLISDHPLSMHHEFVHPYHISNRSSWLWREQTQILWMVSVFNHPISLWGWTG